MTFEMTLGGEVNILKKSWYMQHAPKTIDDIVFARPEDERMIRSWIESGMIPGNVLFSGPPGMGKTATAHILIRSIIQAENDIKRMVTRSVEEIDSLKGWLPRDPVKSKQKIVYIEEFDRISRTAQTTLKEGMMEKYQPKTVYVACTNYPKKIDHAILTRFTFKDIVFKATNTEGIYERLYKVLTEENAEFDSNKLRTFVEKFYKKGLRDLLNVLQTEYIVNDKKITFTASQTALNIEEEVYRLITTIIEIVLKIREVPLKKACLNNPLQSNISSEYQKLVTILHNNYDINYDEILDKLYESSRFLPVKKVISEYHEAMDMKKYPHMHMIACLYDILKCLNEI